MMAGSIPARRTTSDTTRAAKSSGRTSRRTPLCRPIGVRTASTITASGIRISALYPKLAWPLGVLETSHRPQQNPSTHGAGRHLVTVDSLGGIDPSDRRPPLILREWVGIRRQSARCADGVLGPSRQHLPPWVRAEMDGTRCRHYSKKKRIERAKKACHNAFTPLSP